MKKTFAFIFTLLFIVFYFGQDDHKNIDQKVDRFFNQQMKNLKIPGMAVAVIKNGKIIKKTTYGLANLDWKNKVTQHTNFQIASCTKLLTSTLLLKTMYNNRISLEDPVSKYIAECPKEWSDIKVENLISHSSGIADYYESDVYLPTEKIVDAVKKLPLVFKTGSKQQYAQSDFMVLSYIFEKIYNKPFVQILKDEVSIPLKMDDGAFDMEFKVNGQFLRTDIIPEKVTTYYDLNGKMQAYKYLYPQYTYPAGGYFASVDDMANWAVGLDKEVQFPKSFSDNYIYKTETIAGKAADFSKVGWVTGTEDNVLYAGHSGGPGLADILRFPKEGYTIITLSNDGELLPGFSRAVASFYIKELSPKLKIEKFERD
ncbi:serine hydrolase domain-containing protein [Epilithonimonas hungarica]|uniref:serine hydrolase domain-containing protein n=1 Tax=Epilithonimonas hungarica TaxID=454006 RepID=UPI0027D7DA5E|nr:serine hydrolase domain-containing protein [Epilithonimonas hungarica]